MSDSIFKSSLEKFPLDNPSPVSSSGLSENEPMPKAASSFLQLIKERLGELLHLTKAKLSETENPAPLEELLEKIIKLMELPHSVDGVEEVTKKIERLLIETNFRKKHLSAFQELTPREKEVLTLLALGCANKEIGCQLNICLETVKHYRKIIKSKLNISSSADLVQYGQAFNLI